jgi:lysozyme
MSRNYKLSNSGLAEICSYEAWAPKPYLDSGGVKTWLFGATSSDIKNLKLIPWTQEATIDYGLDMLRKHVQKYVDAVNGELNVDVKQHEFDALVSITYNIGTGDTVHDKGGMAGSTFIDLVNAKRPASEVVAAMKRFKYDNGKIIQGLINRRKKEGDLYQYGKYSSNFKCMKIEVNPSTHKPRYTGQIDLRPWLTVAKIATLEASNTIIPTTPNTTISNSQIGNTLDKKDKDVIELEKKPTQGESTYNSWGAVFNLIKALFGGKK